MSPGLGPFGLVPSSFFIRSASWAASLAQKLYVAFSNHLSGMRYYNIERSGPNIHLAFPEETDAT